MEPKKDTLLDSAEQLFTLNGYHGTSMRDIARHAGVSLAMLNYYFVSKELFYTWVVKRIIQRMNESLYTPLSLSEPGAKDRLNQLTANLFRMNQQEHSALLLILNEMNIPRNSAVQEDIQGFLNNYYERIENLIRKGQVEGCFKTGVNVDFIAVMLLNLPGLSNNSRLYPSSVITENQINKQSFVGSMEDCFKEILEIYLRT